MISIFYLYSNLLSCLIIHAMINNREYVDNDLQEIMLENRDYTRYISFQNTILDDKLVYLNLNNYNNIEVKYKLIKNIDIDKEASYKGKIGTIRDLLLKIKVDEDPLFIGLE